MLMETCSVGETVLVLVACVPAKAALATSKTATTSVKYFFILRISPCLIIDVGWVITSGQMPALSSSHSLVSCTNRQQYFRNFMITRRLRVLFWSLKRVRIQARSDKSHKF